MAIATTDDPKYLSLDLPCSATRRSFLATVAAIIGSKATAQDKTEDHGKSTPPSVGATRL
jgi:hypothetical protein